MNKLTGKRPASARPRKNRQASRPALFETVPMSVIIRPHSRIMAVKKTRGVTRLRTTLVTGSARAYEMKKMVSALL